MEKQTKILLGIGAIIAVYLILKPKKVLAAAPISPSEPIVLGSSNMGLRLQEIERELLESGPLPLVNTPWNTEGYDPCATNSKSYECAVSRGGGGVVGPRPINESAPIPKGPCVCITAPCNC